MPSLKDIRRRIGSVKNTQQVTKAMKLVAAAKLRRAQESILAARPYAFRMGAILRSLASRVEQEAHALLVRREEERLLLVVVTSDRGLCGGFNSNVTRRGMRFLNEEARGKEASLACVGRKGHDFFRRRDPTIRHYFGGVLSEAPTDAARRITKALVKDYTGGELDAIWVLYNGFKSAGSQELTLERLLPVDPEELPEGDFGVDYLYEPDQDSLLDSLIPRHVVTQVQRVLLESTAAEHGARMVAMEAATQNAAEMIDHLTLQANRARQAAITKELLEIVAGAEALK